MERRTRPPRRRCPLCGLKGARALHERLAGEDSWHVGCVKCGVAVRLTEDQAAVVLVVADLMTTGHAPVAGE